MGGWLENANMLIKKTKHTQWTRKRSSQEKREQPEAAARCGAQFNLPLTLTKRSHHSSTTNPDANLNYTAPSVHTEEECGTITSTVSFNAKRHKTIYVLKLQDN